jgi:hypothetical protein
VFHKSNGYLFEDGYRFQARVAAALKHVKRPRTGEYGALMTGCAMEF